MDEIIKTIKNLNCEVIRQEVREKSSRQSWSLELKLSIRPISGEEA